MSGMVAAIFILMLSATVSLLTYWMGVHNPWVILSLFFICYFISDVAYRSIT